MVAVRLFGFEDTGEHSHEEEIGADDNQALRHGGDVDPVQRIAAARRSDEYEEVDADAARPSGRDRAGRGPPTPDISGRSAAASRLPCRHGRSCRCAKQAQQHGVHADNKEYRPGEYRLPAQRADLNAAR